MPTSTKKQASQQGCCSGLLPRAPVHRALRARLAQPPATPGGEYSQFPLHISPGYFSQGRAGRISGGTGTLTGPKPESLESRRERRTKAKEGPQPPGVPTDTGSAVPHPRPPWSPTGRPPQLGVRRPRPGRRVPRSPRARGRARQEATA